MNESDKEVYFDDFTIRVMGPRAIRKTDYYPFGAVAKVWNNPDQLQSEKYRHDYQGQYAEKDTTTGWNVFELRMYDPLIGRWLQVDPAGQYSSSYAGMGNNPINGTDPDGAWFFGLFGSTSAQRQQARLARDASGAKILGDYKFMKVATEGVYFDLSEEAFTSDVLYYEFNKDGSYNVDIGEGDFAFATQRLLDDDGLVTGTPLGVEFLSGGSVLGLARIRSFWALFQGGRSFSTLKTLRGGTETLAKIRTSTGTQRISTEFHHVFFTQKAQRAYNLPNWLVNNKLNVWKVNTIQHSLIDGHRFRFLKSGIKNDVGFFKKYNWFTKFN